jgi:murein DD-endopeptidase MepM/ murein hydrolase activator NlpD
MYLIRDYLYYSLIIALSFFIISCGSEKKTEIPKVVEINYDRYGFIADSFNVVKGTIKKNETLADILVENNLDYNLVTEIYNKAKPQFDFKKIRPNKNYSVYTTNDTLSKFYAFVYEIDKIKYLTVELKDSIIVRINHREIVVREKSISGTINSSLYETLSNLNSSIVLAGELADVFAWQIDFYTIQKGDQFFAVYQELYVDDNSVGIGDVLAARFIHKNNHYNAFLFEQNEENEYFDEEGKSLQKAFLKAPLKYKRISSHYTGSRLHPILRVYKPHRGIDYAAAIGTPVQAVGDGIVTKVGRDGAAGKMVKIRHNSVYSSAYLHLSGYGKNIRSGIKVKQGQVIGFVGSTGRSTGPHLDFRFWKNGSLVNYLNQKFPSSKAVNDSNMVEFTSLKDSLNMRLDSFFTESNDSTLAHAPKNIR